MSIQSKEMSLSAGPEPPAADPGQSAGKALPISGGVLAAIVAGAFLLLRHEPVQPSRPRIAEATIAIEAEDVRARLWEDPFAAVVRHQRLLWLDQDSQSLTGSAESRFVRTIGTDEDLAGALIAELVARGVDPRCGSPAGGPPASLQDCNSDPTLFEYLIWLR